VRCEAALPRHEYLPETLPRSEVVVGLVEEAVTQTGTYDGGNQKGVKQGIEQRLGDALALKEPLEDIPAKYESRYKEQGVPSNAQ